MTRVATSLTLLLIACSLGCNSVVLDGPIGDPLTTAEASALVGRWTNDESEIVDVRLVDENRLAVGWLEWVASKQEYVARSYQINARRVGDVMYLFLETNGDAAFGFVHIDRVSDLEYRLLSPNPDAFRAAVEAGRIAGTIIRTRNDHFSVRVEADSSLNRQVLADEEQVDLYNADETQTMRRVKQWESEL